MGEFLSGFWKDGRLIPSIITTIFFGLEEWNEPVYQVFKDSENLNRVFIKGQWKAFPSSRTQGSRCNRGDYKFGYKTWGKWGGGWCVPDNSRNKEIRWGWGIINLKGEH